MENLIVELSDYRGWVYNKGYTVFRNDHGSGWIIYGRSLDGYLPNGIIKKVCRPDKPLRKMPNYNGLCTVGFKTKRIAQSVINNVLTKGKTS